MGVEDFQKQKELDALCNWLDHLNEAFANLERTKEIIFEQIETDLDKENPIPVIELRSPIKKSINSIKMTARQSKQSMRDYRFLLNDQDPLGSTEHYQYDYIKAKIKAGEESPEALKEMMRLRSEKRSKPSGLKRSLTRIESKLSELIEKVDRLEAKIEKES